MAETHTLGQEFFVEEIDDAIVERFRLLWIVADMRALLAIAIGIKGEGTGEITGVLTRLAEREQRGDTIIGRQSRMFEQLFHARNFVRRKTVCFEVGKTPPNLAVIGL